MTTLGVLGAMFAPVSLLVAVLAAAWLLRRLGVRFAGLIATVAVLAPTAWLYLSERGRFDALCAELGEPIISERASADGVLLTSPTAASFGRRYIEKDGFDWIERSQGQGFVRVTADGKGGFNEETIASPGARYEVIESFEKRPGDISVSKIRVVDRETGRELSHAADAVFGGGAIRWALGAYGMTSCQTGVQNAEAFQRFYRLAHDTLRPPTPLPPAPLPNAPAAAK